MWTGDARDTRHKLTVLGGDFTVVSHDVSGASDGLVSIDDTNATGIQYLGVETIDDRSAAATRAVRSFVAGDVNLTLAAGARGTMKVTPQVTGTFPALTFKGPTTRLLLAGGDGNDVLRIASELDIYNAIAREETERRGAHFVDITGISRQHPALLADDGLHPSAAQYALWTEAAVPTAVAMLSA